jgi:hypothetical protein
MTTWLKQSTAVTVLIGPFVDSTDGVTPETALTITQAEVRLSKNSGDMAQKGDATSLTHDEIGYYTCPLSTTDTNTLGILKLMIAESGALPVWIDFMVAPANVWDSLFGADALQVHANEITAGLITAAAIADAAIDAATFAAGAITAAAIATGAVDADALAADAGAEIADAVWDELSTGHVDAGKAGTQLWSDVDDILVDTGTTLDGRIPATLVSGRIDASVGAVAAGAITAAAVATGAIDADALAADAGAEIADAVWDEATSGHTTAGSTGKALISTATLGTGAVTWVYTLTSSVDSSPIADAQVWATTDSAGANVVASGTTSTLGKVTFYLDAGTYYFWRAKAGWNFANPDTETVA